MSTCPNCGFESETVNQRLRRLFVAGGRTGGPPPSTAGTRRLAERVCGRDGAANAEDVIDPRSASPISAARPHHRQPVVRLGPVAITTALVRQQRRADRAGWGGL